MNIRDMNVNDKDEVLLMEKALNTSPAVDIAAPLDVIKRSFKDATSGNPHIKGYIFEEDNKVLGFAYLTFYYSCEVARKVVMIEELFVKDEYRSMGGVENLSLIGFIKSILKTLDLSLKLHLIIKQAIYIKDAVFHS